MKSINLTSQKITKSTFTHLACKIFGHKYRITKQYASNLKEFECTKCKKQFTLDRSGHYIPLTPKLKKVNEVFDRFYKKMAPCCCPSHHQH